MPADVRSSGSSHTSRNPVPSPVRVGVCVFVAIVAAHYAYHVATHQPFHRDLGQLWFAARELLAGRSPYAAIGPGRAFDWPWPLYYPLPAVLAVTPVAWLPEPVAVAAIGALGVGALAWALSAHGYAPLLGLFSFSVWHALHLVQWSPLLAADLVLTPLSALWIVKPTIGAALFAARPTRTAVVAAMVLIGVSFVIRPDWMSEWRAALGSPVVEPDYDAGHYAIVQFAGGVLVLAALLRWRRPEARLLAVLACVPQTVLPYESVLLLLVPRGWVESIAMLIGSHAMYWLAARDGPADFVVRTQSFGQAVTLTMYLPALLMVLRRPNEGPAPLWLDRAISRWPAWLRGRTPASSQSET